jgi:hypothetical protein
MLLFWQPSETHKDGVGRYVVIIMLKHSLSGKVSIAATLLICISEVRISKRDVFGLSCLRIYVGFFCPGDCLNDAFKLATITSLKVVCTHIF